MFALYPVLSPPELQGGGLVRARYADPAKPDGAWAWNPGTRRVRQLDESMLVNPSGIGSWSPDHFGGFNSKLEEYTYKCLGEKDMLASVHAHSPANMCVTGASCADAWEMRKLYIVEAAPPSRQQQLYDSGTRIVIYVDS